MSARFRTYKFDTSSVTGSTDTLNGAVGNLTTDTAVTLTSGTASVNGTVIQVGSEQMYIVSGGGGPNLTVIRAWAGTTIASHSNGATVNLPGVFVQPLWQIATVPNHNVIFAKVSTDINYVELTPFAGDTFPSGASSVMLVDASSQYGTVRMTAPGDGGTQWLVTAGAGGAGASGGGGGGSAPGTDQEAVYNKAGVLFADSSLKWIYGNQSLQIVGGSGTNGQQLIIDTSASSEQAAILFNDQGTPLWQLGRGNTDYFFLWDELSSANIIEAFNSGSLTLAPVTTLQFTPGNSLVSVTGNIVPTSNNAFDLGSMSDQWNTIYGEFGAFQYVIIDSSGGYMKLGIDPVSGSLAFQNSIAQVQFEISVAGLVTCYSDFVPSVTNTYTLGTSSLYWNNVYTENITITSSITLTSSPYQSILSAAALDMQDPAGTTISSMSVLGFITTTGALSTSSGNLNVGGSVVSNLIPSGSITLGSSGSYWSGVYADTGVFQDIIIDGSSGYMKLGIDPSTLALAFQNNIAQTLLEINPGGLVTCYSSFYPSATNSYNLGSSSLYWDSAYITTLVAPSSTQLNVTGNVVISGSLDVDLLGVTTDILCSGLIVANPGTGVGVASNLVPSATNTYNLGSSSYYWDAAYITTLNTVTLSLANLTVSGDLYVGSSIAGRTEPFQFSESYATLAMQSTSSSQYTGLNLLDNAGNLAASFQYGNPSAPSYANVLFFAARNSTAIISFYTDGSNSTLGNEQMRIKADGEIAITSGQITLSPISSAINATNGAVVYNSSSNLFQFYQNGSWVGLGSGSSGVTSLNTLSGGLSIALGASNWGSVSSSGTTVTLNIGMTISTWSPSPSGWTSLTVHYANYTFLPTSVTAGGHGIVFFETSFTATSNGLPPIFNLPSSSSSNIESASGFITVGGSSAAAWVNVQSGNCAVSFYNSVAYSSGTAYTITVSGHYFV
jgi:hypothetical protein